MAIIELEHIRTAFDEVVIHEDISFAVEPGTITALIGGSGSGKSTLLRVMLRLLQPQHGDVRLFGTSIWNSSEEEVRAVQRRFGVLFQNSALFSGLSVGENVAAPIIEQTKIPQKLIPDLVHLRLALAGLSEDTCQKMPSELSGGMKKRAALARALALEPELLFLDEPASGLDPINARAFDHLIRSLVDNLGLTVFMVTHDLDSILSVVDRVIVLDRGLKLADGTPAQVARVDHPWIKEYFSTRKAERA